MCTRAINSFWTKQLVCDIKTKKTLKHLSIHNLRVGTTNMVWTTVESSVTDVKKAVVKARILTFFKRIVRPLVTVQWMQYVDTADWKRKTCYICCRVAQHFTASVNLQSGH